MLQRSFSIPSPLIDIFQLVLVDLISKLGVCCLADLVTKSPWFISSLMKLIFVNTIYLQIR